MNRSPAPVRILLWCALGWGLFLVALSFVLPVVTVLTGRDGPQPRYSLVHTYGLAGALPAVVVLAATTLVASLLRFGSRRPSPAALGWARAVAGLILLTALVTTATLHIGVFIVPLALTAVAAAVVAEHRDAGGPAASR